MLIMSTKKIKKERKLSEIEELIKKVGVDESHMKNVKVVADSFERNSYPQGGYNFMMDLVHFPIDEKKRRYLLVILDLWSRQFDIEALTSKSAASVMDGFQKILKRKYINLDNMVSIKSDDGSEFKGLFKNYFKMESILHTITLPGRHKQLQPIDSLIKLLSRFFNGYMVAQEVKTGKINRDWTVIIDTIRRRLNMIRFRADGDPQNLDVYKIRESDKSSLYAEPKFKIGDMVYRKLNRPEDSFGKVQAGYFRSGDYKFSRGTHEIKRIYRYPNNIRYELKGYKNVAYTETEIRF